MNLARTCRNPKCHKTTTVHVATPRCPACNAKYGPVRFGLDYDPVEAKAALEATVQERDREFERDQAVFLKAMRPTVVTNDSDNGGTNTEQETPS